MKAEEYHERCQQIHHRPQAIGRFMVEQTDLLSRIRVKLGLRKGTPLCEECAKYVLHVWEHRMREKTIVVEGRRPVIDPCQYCAPVEFTEAEKR